MRNLKHFVNKFSQARICVMGDVMLDHYIYGQVNRISPEAPVPVVEVDKDEFRLGGAANCAANICSLNGQAFLIGLIGDDLAGKRIKALLSNSDNLVVTDKRPTTKKTRVVAHEQQVVRIHRESRQSVDGTIEQEVIDKFNNLEFDILVFSDYAKGFLTAKLIAKIVKLTKKTIIVDTKPSQICFYYFYQSANLFTPNLNESCQMLNRELVDNRDELVEEVGLSLQGMLQSNVLITRGEKGMSLFEQNKKPLHVPARTREVYDVSGAGDTVVAVLSLALASGVRLEKQPSVQLKSLRRSAFFLDNYGFFTIMALL